MIRYSNYNRAMYGHLCQMGIEDSSTRSTCPICQEKLKAGDKSIRFVADFFRIHYKTRKFHIVCWLSSQTVFPSSKEISASKKMKLLEDI